VGGSYNGLITFYDLRRSGAATSKETLPFSTSVIEKSHHDPVYDVFWINSKTGNQCVSVSTDGQMLWWDTRRLSEPTDSLQLCTDVKSNGQVLVLSRILIAFDFYPWDINQLNAVRNYSFRYWVAHRLSTILRRVLRSTWSALSKV